MSQQNIPPQLPPPPLPGYATAFAAKPKPRRRWWLWILCLAGGGAMILGLILVVVASVGLGGANGFMGSWSRGLDEYPTMQETWSFGQGQTKAARIDVSGVITQGKKGSIFSFARDPVDAAVRSIRVASQDPEVKAIILVVDSPGGGITASDLIYHELETFKKSDPSRKVVALFGDLAASGGYYIASGSDSIIAHPTTITGSIGVIISTLSLKGFGDKYGIKAVTIASGQNKDILNPFKDLTDEQQKLLQATVDEMHKRFVRLVAQGRKLPEEEVSKVADGRILTAGQALECKLIDKIGYWDDAVAEARRLLKVDSLKVVRYHEPPSFSFFQEAMQNTDLSVGNALYGNTRLMYLWSL